MSTPSAKTVISKTVSTVTPPVKKVVKTVESLPPVKKVVSTVTTILPAPTVRPPRHGQRVGSAGFRPRSSSSASGRSGSGSGAATPAEPLQDPVGTLKKIVAGL